jgi:hypothetical protein
MTDVRLVGLSSETKPQDEEYEIKIMKWHLALVIAAVEGK